MTSFMDFKFIFNELYTKLTGESCETISPIAESGSMRKYFRINGKSGSFIGTFNPDVHENEAFFSFSETFSKLQLPVPEVLIRSGDNLSYLQTDLGVVSLFSLIQENHSKGSFSNELIQQFKQIISYLIQFQIIAHKSIDYKKAYPSSEFTSQSILNDLEYFKYYFLKLHPEIIFNDENLQNDFQSFTNFISKSGIDHFMYRDFQSRNIMIFENKPYFIDFQGGRKGPLQYDIVSLLYQVKAQIPDTIREELLGYYLAELKKQLPTKESNFLKYYNSFVYLRLFQVLGAYGFRGLIQKKAHFIDSIPYALKTISEFYLKNNFDGVYTELERIVNQLSKLDIIYPSKNITSSHSLSVQVSSFSYLKKGIPIDFSGNGGGFVFDCRALPNPGREDKYKIKTGKDAEVIAFLESKEEVRSFFEHVKGICGISITNYIDRGFESLVINFGCTGGQHRSVFFAEKMFHWIKQKFPGIQIAIKHSELE